MRVIYWALEYGKHNHGPMSGLFAAIKAARLADVIWLSAGPEAKPVALAKEMGADQLWCVSAHLKVTPAELDELHRAGIKVVNFSFSAGSGAVARFDASADAYVVNNRIVQESQRGSPFPVHYHPPAVKLDWYRQPPFAERSYHTAFFGLRTHDTVWGNDARERVIAGVRSRGARALGCGISWEKVPHADNRAHTEGEAYRGLIESSRSGIDIMQRNGPAARRILEHAATGAPCFIQSRPEVEFLLPEEAYFGCVSVEDMIEQIAAAAKSPEELERRGRLAYEHTREHHTLAVRAAQLMCFINQAL